MTIRSLAAPLLATDGRGILVGTPAD